MRINHSSSPLIRPSLSFALLLVLLGVLWVAGGSSRADASGQVVVRGVCWTLLIIAILFGQRPSFTTAKPILLLLLMAILLALLQLVPLPPNIWLSLSGREIFAAAALGQDQPWRPLSIVPSATVNAVSSLIVPLTTLVLAMGLKKDERLLLPAVILCFVMISTLLALLQFSGSRFDNPLINDVHGYVSGIFANQNHFALLLAIGCLLAPAWAFSDRRRSRWRGPVALGLLLLFSLTILATGSRAGLLLGLVAIGIGILIAWNGVRDAASRAPRWVFPALIASIIGLIAIAILASVAADRAVSINRMLELDPLQDMRSRGLPTVLEMIRIYFPYGSGFGAFDPIFRIHEPFGLLKVRYFNHAHNDYLEIALDGGLPGLLLLVGGLLWWGIASFRLWRTDAANALAKAGSATLLLVFVASAFDYPARTPTIMAMIILAGVWLCRGTNRSSQSALPTNDQHL